VALQQVDGATIKRLIDDWGRTPLPYRDADGGMVYPPAYQKVLKGCYYTNNHYYSFYPVQLHARGK